MSEEQLHNRIPLSVAQWHEHVNLCLPPAGRRQEMVGLHPKFGLAGSISTQDADVEGGKFLPVIFGWMVQVYPFETSPEKFWSVEPQHEQAD